MSLWEIVPFQRVGELVFGMYRTEVDKLHLGPSRVVRKAGQLAEQFVDRGIVIYYRGASEDQAGIVEFSGPDFPSVDGKLLDRAIKGDPNMLGRFGLQVRRDRAGEPWVDELGIAFYMEGDSFAVTVFSRRDFDEASTLA